MSELPRHSVSVTAAVFRDDGRVLAIRREDDGRWVPPGGVVSHTFRCHPVVGEPRPSDEALESAWLSLEEVQSRMPEALGIRVMDALREDGPFVRVHDRTRLL
ncbi:NUDIX hydrolase [Microbispora sp. NBC_01189]|nr:NUDIX hydrolase [Microbispora sp. NBC_01189]